MSWEHELTGRIKAQGRTGPGGNGYLRGDVISPKWDEEAEDWVKGELIISAMGGEVMLREEHLDILGHVPKLHDGMTVILLPGSGAFAGGMRFCVLGVIGDAV